MENSHTNGFPNIDSKSNSPEPEKYTAPDSILGMTYQNPTLPSINEVVRLVNLSPVSNLDRQFRIKRQNQFSHKKQEA